MGYAYTTIDGQRVEKHVALEFKKLAAAFRKRWGLTLHVRAGTRTRAQQEKLYYGWLHRLPGYSLAARPGFSNHEESGPRGPRALDLYDTGRDAGVTVIGSARSNWLAANAPRYGFTNAGHSFKPAEGWHYEYTGSLTSILNPNPGKLTVDGDLGPSTIRALQKQLGTPQTGAITHGKRSTVVAALQKFLNAHGARDWDGKPLAVDGVGLASNHGSKQGKTRTIYALQRYLGTAADGYLDKGASGAVKALQKRLNGGKL